MKSSLKKHILTTFMIIFLFGMSNQGLGQEHLQLHIALAGMFTSSDDLDNFTATYNALNQTYLTRHLDGMSPGVGWRWGAGYRHFDKFNYALMIGLYQVAAEDQARFTNGERREFKLDIRSPFAELDAGYFTGTYLFNGVVSFYFNKQIKLETEYVSFDPADRPLDGIYRGQVNLSVDMGLKVGMVKYPFLITAIFTFPVYSSHDGSALSNGMNEFPSDYFAYVGKGEYPGLSADLDGFKIIVTLGYLFQF